MSREFDVVLYGAGGFVGRHVVAYFAGAAAGLGLRWAIAGRTRDKLEAAKRAAGAPSEVPVLVADGRDEAAIDALAARTRVMLSTAGPFAVHGDALVTACVSRRTHYVDITGETPWVRSLIDRHHEKASADGTRIVPCCGFDSVPSDLGAFLAVRRLQRLSSAPCDAVKGYYQLSGGLNGGTVASALSSYASGQAADANDPFLLDGHRAPSPAERAAARDPARPRYDADVGTWVGPFVMGPVNTRVVRRSAALFAEAGQPYSAPFTYQELARFDPPFARVKAQAAAAALGLFNGTIRRRTGRRLLRALLPRPGVGPSDAVIERGWFRCEIRATARDGTQVRVVIEDDKDPGNRATAQFVCESALCVAEIEAQAPRRGGVLTPATAFGQQLVDRLRAGGVTLQVTDATVGRR